MPITQPKRDNPLMRRYFQKIGLSGKRLAKQCGVSHSQIYMARTRNVGADNAEMISRGMVGVLGLSETERLELKAEIMGPPRRRGPRLVRGPGPPLPPALGFLSANSNREAPMRELISISGPNVDY